MKLKEGFITMQSDGEQIMVSVGDTKFAGLVRSNKTAAFIVDCMKSETTKDAIVEAMAEKYDAPKDILAKDVEGIIAKLRSIGALDE